MDIIYVDTPSGEAAEKSNSYNLSIFSFGADSEGVKVVTATCEDSSPSIGELWPGIDKFDILLREDTFVVYARDASIHGKRSAAAIENADKCSRHDGSMDSLLDVAGTSNFRSKRCDGNLDSLPDVAGTFDFRSKRREGGSVRREAARILFAAPDAISPCMRRSFVDRRYSPSIGMGLSE
jgi:hypothetical protein